MKKMGLRQFVVAIQAPFVLWAFAPAERAQQIPTFQGRTDVVALDVSVWDKNGEPVRGLSAGRFKLLEDGKPREVVSFSAVEIADPPAPTAPWMRDAFHDVVLNDVAAHRLFLILVDDASFRGQTLQPSLRERVQESARAVIRHLGPGDLAAVIFTGDNRRSQDFTLDHARLLAAVNQMAGVSLPSLRPERRPGDLPVSSAQALESDLSAQYSVTVLEKATEALLEVPGRRKALVDITNFDMDMSGVGHLITRTRAIFQKAQNAGVNVYTVRPRVLPLRRLPPDYWEGRWIRRVARETGGAFFDGVWETGDAERTARSIFMANASYYILGYLSADLRKFHNIKVTVDVPGAVVRTRDKYYWPAQQVTETGPPPPPLGKSIAGILPAVGIPMRTSLTAFADPKGNGGVIAAVTSVRIAPLESSLTRGKLEFAMRVFTAEGDPRGESASEMIARGSAAEFDAQVFTQLAVTRAGLYEVRLAASRPEAGLAGSVYGTIDVPDFARLPVSFSGVILSVDDSSTFYAADEAARLLPIRPTIRREFSRTDRVRASVRMYVGNRSELAPIPVRVRIFDDHGGLADDRSIAPSTESLRAAGFADVIAELPLARLAPGPYLLTFETTLNQTRAYREVRFLTR